ASEPVSRERRQRRGSEAGSVVSRGTFRGVRVMHAYRSARVQIPEADGMRPLLGLHGNSRKLALKSAGAIWPPNLLVVARNASDGRRGEPWSNFVPKTGDPGATVRAALERA